MTAPGGKVLVIGGGIGACPGGISTRIRNLVLRITPAAALKHQLRGIARSGIGGGRGGTV